MVKPELWESLQVEDYVQARYQQSLAEMPALPGRPCGNAAARRSAGCPLNWFMSTLLDRKDRMSMAAGLEVRVPFCDHHLVEYVEHPLGNEGYERAAQAGAEGRGRRPAPGGAAPPAQEPLPQDPRPPV